MFELNTLRIHLQGVYPALLVPFPLQKVRCRIDFWQESPFDGVLESGLGLLKEIFIHAVSQPFAGTVMAQLPQQTIMNGKKFFRKTGFINPCGGARQFQAMG